MLNNAKLQNVNCRHHPRLVVAQTPDEGVHFRVQRGITCECGRRVRPFLIQTTYGWALHCDDGHEFFAVDVQQ